VSNETTPATTPSSANEVRIWVDRDDDANRVSAVLEALGYTVLRELEEGDGPARLRWAVNRLARRHKLTPREQDILERVLAGRNNEEIGKDLEISRATVKWHMHNIFAKTNTGNRESLLRLALQLGGRRSQDESELDASTEVEEEAPIVRQSELPTEPHKAANTPKPHELIPAAAVPSKSWF
jgi:DNA-binding CsgD family transcriptional regulator